MKRVKKYIDYKEPSFLKSSIQFFTTTGKI